MTKRQASSLKERARRAQGLAPPDLIRPASPGAVYKIKDEAIQFPLERLPDAGPRSKHTVRWVIVAQAANFCRSAVPQTISVVPCSASSVIPGPCDLLLENESGFTEAKVVAYVSMLQPVLKSDLVEFCGYIGTGALPRFQAVLLRNLGFLPPTALPSSKPR